MAKVEGTLKGGSEITDAAPLPSSPNCRASPGDINVSMRLTATEATQDLAAVGGDTQEQGGAVVQQLHPVHEPRAVRRADQRSRRYETRRCPDKICRLQAAAPGALPALHRLRRLRLLKVATEAFVAVNCGVTLTSFPFDRRPRLRLRRVGKPDRSRQPLAPLPRVGERHVDPTLPYLALIRDKLRDVRLKSTSSRRVDEATCRGLLRHPADEADRSLPARADLVVLARGGHAGADDERDHAGASRTCAAAATAIRWRNLEIDPLRPLNNLLWGYIQDEQHRLTRGAAGLRVRPSLRPDAARQGRADAAAGGQPLEVPRGLPQPAAPLRRSSTRRTTTPP